MTIENQLKEIRARCEMASQGPWVWNKYQNMVSAYSYEADGNTRRPCTSEEIRAGDFYSDGSIIQTDSGMYGPEEQDRDFIAKSRQDIPFLLTLCEKLLKNKYAALDVVRKSHCECYENLLRHDEILLKEKEYDT